MSEERAALEMRGRALAHQIRLHQDRRYARSAKHAVAYVTGTNRDGAQRNTSANVTVDGLENQTMAISYGAPVYTGESWLVRNDGSATLPRWMAVRRLSGINATPELDRPTLPAPTGLLLETQSYVATPIGGSQRAWVYAYWYIIGDEYGPMIYEVEYSSNDFGTPGEEPGGPGIMPVRDDGPSTQLALAIDATQTIIPRLGPGSPPVAYDFVRKGRMRIESELIDYGAVSIGTGETGSGVGAPTTFTVAAAGWTINKWLNYVLVDSGGHLHLILSNSGEVLTVAGTPLSGAYTIYPCFSGCSRGASGTSNVAHILSTGVTRMSHGTTLPQLFVETDYNVRVRAVRDDGAISAWTAWSSITTGLDATAPAAPTGFAASSEVGGVWFSWTGPLLATEPDLGGFNIYEAEDDAGTGATLLTYLPVAYGHFYSLLIGYDKFYNIKSRDLAANLSGYGEATWVYAVSLPRGGANLLTNGDFERDFDGDGWADHWYEDTNQVAWGDYGRENGKGLQFSSSGKGYSRLTHWPYPITDYKVKVAVGQWYTASAYFWSDEDEDLIKYTDNYYDDFLCLSCHFELVDDSGWSIGGIIEEAQFKIYDLGDGWRRVAWSKLVTEADVSPLGTPRYMYLVAYCRVRNEIAGGNTVLLDRVQLEQSRFPSEWMPGIVPPGDGSATAGLLIDAEGILTSDKTFALSGDGKIRSGIKGVELSADPTTPDEGEWVMWMSDGSDSGADGDIMIKIKAGGATKTATLVDFSAV